MRALIRHAVALLALAASATAFAGLPGSISGTWYNPAQSGHGLSLDVLAGDRAIAIWHVFDPNGRPLTLYIEAQIDGRRLSGPAYAPRGMRFGIFDPAELQLPVWGQVEIRFSSCDEAELSWRSTQAGFPDGRMPLVRLAQATGRECVLLPESALPHGLYIGAMDAAGGNLQRALEGIVDADGRLWGFERSFGLSSRLPIPGVSWVGAYVPRTYRIEPTAAEGNQVRASGPLYAAVAFAQVGSVPTGASSTSGLWRIDSAGAAQGEFLAASAAVGIHRWRPGAPAGSALVAPVNLTQLQGRYTFPLGSQFFDYASEVRIEADGSICITYGRGSFADSAACRMRGNLSTPEGQFGLIDFTMSDDWQPANARYRGRGWLLDRPSGRELILVGDNGAAGFLVVAYPH